MRLEVIAHVGASYAPSTKNQNLMPLEVENDVRLEVALERNSQLYFTATLSIFSIFPGNHWSN
jgi:hypothetical protein